MPEDQIPELKRNIVAIGRLLWEKELVSGLNGNISVRVDPDRILLTATKTCLGLLQPKDVLLMQLDGQVMEEGEVSTEKPLHTEIYKNFPEVHAVIHTHTLFTNAYFLEKDVFTPRILEAKLWFGELQAVEQLTPTVTDVAPIIGSLKKNGIAVLRNHGVVAAGKDLFNCFLLIQTLEEAIHTEAIARAFREELPKPNKKQPAPKRSAKTAAKKFKLFSKDQIDEIVRLVNADSQLKDLGSKTQMSFHLAIKLAESGKAFGFHFENGKIIRVGTEAGAEFVLTAPEKIWRAVFNREIDPFVATNQKKIVLRGDLGKLSKWYVGFQRMFELWTKVPVE